MSTDRWKYNRNDQNENRPKKDLGEQIEDLVQSAVDSLDFSGLGESIKSAVEEAKPKVDQFKNMADQSYREVKQEFTRHSDSYRYRSKPGVKERPVVKRPRELSAVFRKVPGRYSGPLTFGLGLIGFCACGAFGLGLGFTILGGVVGAAIKVACGLTGVIGLGFGALAIRGWLSYKKSVRYLKYQRLWNNRSHITVEQLHQGTGYPVKQIKKDLHQIMEEHLLPISYMDAQETCFILTKEAYEQYQEAESSRLQREHEEEQKRLEEEALEQASPQGKTILKMRKDAEVYKKELLEKKQKIGSLSVQEKIDKLIIMMDRIYDCIEEHPEQYSQIYRLNDYYIPTILKLLTTYAEVEDQPVQGENILKIKKEIEESLDMINKAMQIMFDELFQDIAMDTSADIDVLETMLAREGLTKRDLKADENAADIRFM